MRLFPLVTAVLVAAALYFVVLDRDRLVRFASGPRAALMQQEGGPETAQPTQAANEAAQTPEAAPPESPESADAAVGVVVLPSTASDIDAVVTVRGETRAVRRVEMRAETTARVVSEPLQSGVQVEAGDVLCELDPGTSQAALTEARAQLAEAEINNRAAERLLEEGFASETRKAATQAALQAARAAVERAELQISYLTIRAPFGGILETDSAELGALLRQGDLCAEVIRLDPILLVGFLPETEVSRVTLGAPATARLATGAEVAGEVTFISRSADPDTRTFRIEVTVPNPQGTIRDGQTAEISIETAGTRAHFLPGSALTLNNDGALGVRSVDAGNIVRFIPVRVLRDTPEGVWVTGLPETLEVIVVGQEYVVEGVRVAPVRRDALQ